MKRTLIYGAAALGLLFTSCSSENLAESDVKTPLGSDQTFFVNMRISGDAVSGSRSGSENGSPILEGDFEDGTATENAVNNVYFVFYDAVGNVVGDIVPVDLSTFKENDQLLGNTVEKAYSSTIPVSVKKGELKPSQVICYINPISPPTLQNPLSVIQTISRTNVTTNVNGQTYFGMSNSVYYPNGEADDSLPQIAVEIPEDNLFTTEAAAEAALGTDATVDIYVERYAVKLKFEAVGANPYVTSSRIYGEDGKINETLPEITLNFEPQYWALNAEANRSYVIKSFREPSPTGDILGENYTYASLNGIINIANPNNSGTTFAMTQPLGTDDAWDWNNPNYFRSYWACSPAYFQSEYPEVSSDLEGITDIKQKYIAYNELEKLGFAASDKDAKYFRETTVGEMALASKNPVAAMPSVIYVGKYNITIDGNEVAGNPSFYTYLSGQFQDGTTTDGKPNMVTHPYVYFNGGAAVGSSEVAGGESMLRRFLAQTTILYKAVLNNNEIVDYTRLNIANNDDLNILSSVFEVSPITEDVKKAYTETYEAGGEAKFQNNTRTLQFKTTIKKVDDEDVRVLTDEAKSNMKNLYILTGNGYCKVVDDKKPGNGEISLAEANLTLMRQVGYSYYYTTGHAYFNIPVKHYGWYRNGNTQKYVNATDKTPNESNNINWNIVRVGDFGMVRNHSYSINVSSITGLAQGIGDDWNPIVPPSHSEDYYMAYSVRILKWAVVPTQNVVL